MPYIKRDEQGAICAISQTQTADFDEAIDVDAAELTSFLSQWNAGKNDLNESDLGFIRVLEDLIELLINKNLICFTDLPDAARAKIQKRQRLREDLAPCLDLLFDDDNHSFG